MAGPGPAIKGKMSPIRPLGRSASRSMCGHDRLVPTRHTADAIKGALLVSGMYDLYPVMLSSRCGYLTIAREEEAALSVVRHLDQIASPIAIVSADQDSPEFKRQSALFAGALEGTGRLASRAEPFDTDHFQELRQLARADNAPGQVLLSSDGYSR